MARLARAGNAVTGVLVALLGGGCDAIAPGPSFDQASCVIQRLDAVAEPAALFTGPRPTCLIVSWDSEMDGAGIGPDGGVTTPPDLAAAARADGYASPCETTVAAQKPSPERSWFTGRFGALDPRAQIWGATLFVPVPIPDGIQPACAAVTPPR